MSRIAEIEAETARLKERQRELASKPKIGSQWVKGVSGNPKGRAPGVPNKTTVLRNAFAEGNASMVLNVLHAHAMNDPTTARWLAARIFGEGTWVPPVDLASATTIEACQQAVSGALDAYVAGQIDAKELGTITKALTARMEQFAHACSGEDSGESDGDPASDPT